MPFLISFVVIMWFLSSWFFLLGIFPVPPPVTMQGAAAGKTARQ